MAKVLIPDSAYVAEAKLLQPNSHNMVAHCLEYYKDKVTLYDNVLEWKSITSPCNSSLPHPELYVSRHVTGWQNPKDAAANMMAYKACHPSYSFRISRYPIPQDLADELVAASVWQAREAARMADGTYEPLPWAEEAWFKERHASFNHFAHVSQEKDGMIAFTENRDKGANDIQKRMAPGRYLSTYFASTLEGLPNFDSGLVNVLGEKVTIDPIQHYARLFSRTYGDTTELKFATTQDDMIMVYKKGPDSCMTFRGNQYQSEVHPVSVYAAGDLQLAYLVQKDGAITARALVWPEKKKVGRTYGDSASILFKLLELGYDDPKGSFDGIAGARMLKIEHEGSDSDCHVMPFLDACGSSYYDGGDYWIMGKRPMGSKAATYNGGYTHGLSSDDYDPPQYDYHCEHCDEGCNETWTVYTANRRNSPVEQSWCEYCFDNDTYTCAETNERYSHNMPHVTLADGDPVAICNIEENYFQCAFNSNWYHVDDLAGQDCDGDSVSNDAVKDLGLVQDTDGNWEKPEDANTEAANDLMAPEAPLVTLDPEPLPLAVPVSPNTDMWLIEDWRGIAFRFKVVNSLTGDYFHNPHNGDVGYHTLHEATLACDIANQRYEVAA